MYPTLKPVGSFYTSGSRLAPSMKPVGSLFVPDGSELRPGGDEYVAQLGIRLPPSSPTSCYFLVLLFFLGFDRSLFLGTGL